jgi:hypothetical protein
MRARAHAGCGGLQKDAPGAGGCMNLAGIGARAAPAARPCLSPSCAILLSLPLHDVAVRENQLGGGGVRRRHPWAGGQPRRRGAAAVEEVGVDGDLRACLVVQLISIGVDDERIDETTASR